SEIHAPDTNRRDFVFLLDGSDATRSGFPAMRDFVQSVVQTLSVDDSKDRVSVVQYSREPAVQFYLNTYTTQGEILDSVRGLRHKGGRPLNTGAALQYLSDNVFTVSAGSRRLEGVPQVLILLTLQYVRDNVLTSSAGSRHLQGVPQILILLNGGRSSDNVDTPASTLKQLGVLTFAIGTRGSDSAELQRLSSDPSHALSDINWTIVKCVVPSSVPVVPKKPAGRDFVFLLDGSDATRSGFPAMRDFVQSVVQTLSVDDSKDRVSVVQYSREPAVQFYLNTYTTQGEILDSVRGLRHKGGRPLNTGAALQYLSDNVFTVSAGSRRLEGVPQVLILLSGGRSADNVDAQAAALKQLGVLTFAIGTRNSDSKELQKIAHSPTYALSVSEFNDLPSVRHLLKSTPDIFFMEITPESPTIPVDTAKKDIVFLLDGSDGTRNGFPAMLDFVERVVEKLNVGENKDRVSVVQYSIDAEAHFYLNTYTTKDDIVGSVRGLRHRGGRAPNTGAALQYVRDNVLTSSAGSRHLQGVPQILILLNGGRSSDNVDTPASTLKQLGVLTFAIGTRGSDSAELQRLSSDPSHALSVSDFTDLPMPVVPLNMSQTLYFLAEKKPAGRDFVFLLDGSDATRSGFPAMRDFVQSVVQTLSVDDSKDRVSVVQYSREPAVQFYLNTYTTQGEILDSVRGLRHKGGRPLNTGAALQYLSDNVFTVSAGSRRLEGVPQVLILLSGGRSADNVDAQAAALKQLGVLTFAIGTRNSDSKELQKIAHSPTYVYFKCSQLLFSCLFSVDTAKKDIVFLLDGSDGTRNGFPAMLDFVERVVEKLNVGENKDRVSVVQYSIDAEAHFYLNTYTTKDDIVGSVRGLRHRGGRAPNTGAALQYVRDNVLTSSAGSRHLQGVPQILILLNGGRSSDNVDTPASTLKQLGVLTFAIGTRGSDSAELQRLSSDPSHALSVSDFTDLPIQCQLSEKKPAGRDFVFLLDGSDATRSGFPAMRDFVQSVVQALSVDDSKNRVSVVQYSREPAVQFYLNTYMTQGEILDSVRGLRHKGGRPLNTGAALQYLSDNVFTVSAGSRRLEGVPQVLILLSGGRSADNVDTPASALKQLGVLTFAIGTRGSDSAELQRLSSDPSHALSVSDFTDLPSVQEQLSSVMSRVLVRSTPRTPTVTGRDFVFLLDGSDATRSGFPAMRDFVQSVVQTLSVDDSKDRVSVVQYSREPAVQFYLNTYTTQGEILDSVRGLRHRGGRPLNTGAALQYLSDNVFTVSAGSRRLEGVPQVLILLSGGRSADNVDAQAAALKQLGVLTFAIGTRNSDSKELQKIAHSPTYALSVSEFNDLPSLSSVMSRVLVRSTPRTPTLNMPQTLYFLAEKKPAGRDFVFLLDGSDATRSGFPAMRDFVQSVVQTLSVDDSKDRVSVVQYSREPAVQFYLNTYTTQGEILDSVRGLRHRGGRPLNTGAALQYLSDNVFTVSAGSRRLEGVTQVLILLSGGRSADNVDAQAAALKQLGVLTFAIGTRNSDSKELQKIAHSPTYALSVSEFNDLPSVRNSQVYFKGSQLLFSCLFSVDTAKKDIVFLLDGSDGTRNGFPAMLDFVERVVEKLNVGENKDRVSVVQYSIDAEAHFYLNTYTTKDDIVGSVRGLRHRGGRAPNTGAALQYVRDNVLTSSAGSRHLQGVPQILILLNGGRSSDNVDTPASTLKQLGVLTFAIGTRGSDSAELQRLSSDPSHALSVSDFTDLPSVQEQLSSVMSRVLVRSTPRTPTVTGKKLNMSQTLYFLAEKKPAGRDFVFLLDGSDATRSGFPAMRDFVQSVVQTLSGDDSKNRVSVVQYSREPAVQFYLNTYMTQGEILDSVRGLRHKGGRPLNTGAALQYLSDNVFTVSAGSRRLEGVPQVLILLSGGRSADNVDAQAAVLKQLGVLTFAIGTRGSDSAELQRLSSDPSHALSVSDFTDLPSVQEQLSSVMSRVLVRSTPRTPTVTGKKVTDFYIPKS
uniref:Collagen, type VI, alpha 3 n=1 Tax=Mastacembelus armatus TaxID=205130 RepID=A0A3Q3LVW3_9TELE